ncbi:MAG: LysR substrate-binding domain-containing protein [Flavobacteriales bacterium]|jgi:LysR family hydrogen peroxide-inducible transcriptional activator|nr:LysR substrate-binding domain-containing protein [Flavobacteriales bacterium]
MITIAQLEYIVAIDTYRHFVTAAEKCFVTQPTLSMQIKKLEEHLGVTIFDRSKQPIIPTDIGEKIIKQARIVLTENQKINEIVDEFNSTLSGDLTIGVIPSLSPYLLPLFIGRLTSNYPQINVTVIELLTEDIISKLKNDTIDVGILVTPLKEPSIIETPIFYEKMLLFANKSHPLATKQTLETSEITSEGLWLLGKGHCFRSQVVNLCSYQDEHNDEAVFKFESGSLETIKKIIETEGGYTLLPELAINNCNPENTIIRHFDSETPVREVGIVYSRNHAKKRMLEALKTTIEQTVPEKLLNAERGQVVEWR